jgi:hypothetical protein
MILFSACQRQSDRPEAIFVQPIFSNSNNLMGAVEAIQEDGNVRPILTIT